MSTTDEDLANGTPKSTSLHRQMKMEIHVTPATTDETTCIENLMQFYNYDLSEHYPIPFSNAGRYPLQPKHDYWAKPKVFPFLIRVGNELAGFAVVDDEVLDAGTEFNLGYFFIARRFRHQGVGHRVAQQLFARFPGRWEIYCLARNSIGGRFWPSVLSDAAISSLVQSPRIIHGEPSILFRFSITPPAASPAC